MPDKVDPPHATGLAAQTVEAHSAANDLVFHAGWFCPFVQRVWIALEEKGTPYQYKEVNPYAKEPHFLKVNPKGLVPAIEYKGEALYESLVLLDFLEALPSSTSPLLPSDPLEAGRVRLATLQISNIVVPSFYKLLQAQEPAAQDEAREAFVKALKDVVEQWFLPGDQGEGEGWARSQFGWVEVALAPWVVRLYLLEQHRGFRTEEVGERFVRWAEKVSARDSVKRTSSEEWAYESSYERYLTNTAESEVAKATRKGEWLK
ncbi:hypothetical protein JCM10207_005270 [Rhodosporidiobolus poonsookiae]